MQRMIVHYLYFSFDFPLSNCGGQGHWLHPSDPHAHTHSESAAPEPDPPTSGFCPDPVTFPGRIQLHPSSSLGLSTACVFFNSFSLLSCEP